MHIAQESTRGRNAEADRSQANRTPENQGRKEKQMSRLRNRLGILGILSAALLVLTSQAVAKDRIQQTIDIPSQFVANVQAMECSAAPGPRVTVAGNLMVAPVDLEVIFSHLPGAQDPQASTVVKRMVVPSNAAPIPATQQEIRAPISGNPYLWLQLTDSKGRALTSEVFLGRCDQGQFSPTLDLAVPSEAFAQ